MKHRKEKSLIWDYGWIIELIAVIISLIVILWYLSPTKQEQRFCEDNPEKCVCENYIYKPCIDKACSVNRECSKLRKKTQSELDIDSCSSNPRENELCKCEEYDDDIADLRDVEINETKSKNLNINLEEISLSECFKLKICYIPHNLCIKSRPKTDWENSKICDGSFLYINDDDTGETLKIVNTTNKCWKTICRENHCTLWKLYFKEGFEETNHTYLYTEEALNVQVNEDFLNDIESIECIKWVT